MHQDPLLVWDVIALFMTSLKCNYIFLCFLKNQRILSIYLIDGLLRAGRVSSALAMELRLSCANPSMCWLLYYVHLLPFIWQKLCRCPWYIYTFTAEVRHVAMYFFSLSTAIIVSIYLIDGLVQERHVSSAFAVELGLSCANPSICRLLYYVHLLPFIWQKLCRCPWCIYIYYQSQTYDNHHCQLSAL